MHARGAGGNYHVRKFLFLNGLLEKILPRIGTHVFIVGGESNTGKSTDLPGNPLNINGPGDIFTAMADEYAYSGHSKTSLKPVITGVVFPSTAAAD
jgi:hypothetical protein